MRFLIFVVCAVALSVFSTGCPSHNLLRKTDVKWDVDLVGLEQQHWDDLLASHLLPEGLVVEMVRPPLNVAERYKAAIDQADGGFQTGIVLATLVLKYKATGDPAVLEQAKKTCDALHFLKSGSGYRGLVARSFGKDNPDDPDYVFNKVSSGDQLIGWLFGNSFYAKHIDDPARKARIAADLLDICWHLKRHNLQLYVNEDTPIPLQYGGFRTPLYGVPVGNYAMPMMALANFAVKMNPDSPDARGFLGWLITKDYQKQSQYFYAWFPHRSFNVNIYTMASTMAFMWDDVPKRLQYYRAGREAFWDRTYDWQMPPYALLYRHMGGERREENYKDDVARIRNLTLRYRRASNENAGVKTHMVIVPLEDRIMSGYMWSTDVFLEAPKPEPPYHEERFARVDFLFAYWLGRSMGEYGTEPDSSP